MSSSTNTIKLDNKTEIYKLECGLPEIYGLDSQTLATKAVVVISPGLCTRHLHLKEPFLGFQLAKLGYQVYVINTLDLGKYNLNEGDPFARVDLNKLAYNYLRKLHPSQKIVSLGHSLGCIDLLRAQPASDASVFISPGFKGDKGKFNWVSIYKYLLTLLLQKEFLLMPHGFKHKEELADYKSDSVNPKFLWKLQKYAHGLEKSTFWPLNKPCFAWLGSDGPSDGIMKTAEARHWIENMKIRNDSTCFVVDRQAGHEPGWKDAKHSTKLATQIDNWLLENLLNESKQDPYSLISPNSVFAQIGTAGLG
jgi:hypothetical protein